jgi:hypothetical protein
MYRRNHANQKAFYRQQASECAAAASATSVAEVKQAYLDLEQGWLSLAPSGDENPVFPRNGFATPTRVASRTNKRLLLRSD